jgi:hypothetical protein
VKNFRDWPKSGANGMTSREAGKMWLHSVGSSASLACAGSTSFTGTGVTPP